MAHAIPFPSPSDKRMPASTNATATPPTTAAMNRTCVRTPVVDLGAVDDLAWPCRGSLPEAFLPDPSVMISDDTDEVWVACSTSICVA